MRTLLGVPVALVSLLDERRKLFPGTAGLREPWASARLRSMLRGMLIDQALVMAPRTVSFSNTRLASTV
ncbi:hypothetical protein [Micromonospora sp. NPDC005707]|uniref:hypothetical protein n=1 Tax=Micromonospora sp. NPDC005707 TaxID=3157050 RepID=UPI0033E68E82